MSEKITKQIELAEAQILGFHHCYCGASIIDLIGAMGLTREEWETIKNEMTVKSYLPGELFEEIEKHMNQES